MKIVKPAAGWEIILVYHLSAGIFNFNKGGKFCATRVPWRLKDHLTSDE